MIYVTLKLLLDVRQRFKQYLQFDFNTLAFSFPFGQNVMVKQYVKEDDVMFRTLARGCSVSVAVMS